MNKELAEFLAKVTNHSGNQEADVRENYSGRGMYGRETYAIVVNSETQLISDLVQYMAESVCDTNEGEENQGWCGGQIPDSDGGLRVDSMGRDVVIY